MRKKEFLSRYEKNPAGIFMIDVTTSKAGDLYNNFDRSVPYSRRDLDQDLVDYLIDSARELRHELFAIRFTFDNLPDEVLQSRIRKSITGYFLYLAELEHQKIRRMMRRSMILMAIGISIMFFSIQVNQAEKLLESVVGKIFAEGLTVAAWVSLWESLATFLIEWSPHRAEIKLFKQLADSKIFF